MLFPLHTFPQKQISKVDRLKAPSSFQLREVTPRTWIRVINNYFETYVQIGLKLNSCEKREQIFKFVIN